MNVARLVRRTLLASILLGISSPATIAAADKRPGEPKPETSRPDGDRPRGDRPQPGTRMERMKRDILALDLTPEQEARIEKIFSKTGDDLATLRRQNEGKELTERREAVRALMQSLREQVSAVLSEEQRQALRQRMARAVDGARDGGNRLAERMKGMMQSIDLTDEQETKLDALLAASEQKMQAINEETRGKVRELMAETRGQINELLTPEQREKFRQVMPERVAPRDGGQRPAQPPVERL